MEDSAGTKEFLLRYPDLVSTANILTDLIKVNPNLMNDIVMLAMVIAIHSEIKYKINADKMELVRNFINKLTPQW